MQPQYGTVERPPWLLFAHRTPRQPPTQRPRRLRLRSDRLLLPLPMLTSLATPGHSLHRLPIGKSACDASPLVMWMRANPASRLDYPSYYRGCAFCSGRFVPGPYISGWHRELVVLPLLLRASHPQHCLGFKATCSGWLERRATDRRRRVD